MDDKQERARARARVRARRTRRRLLKAAGLLLAVGLFGGAVFSVAGPALSALPDGEAQQAVRATAQAQMGTIEKTVYGAGTVQPRSQPGVYAGTDGTVAERLVELGDEVHEGDVLMVLSNEALEQEMAELEYALWEAQEAVEATETFDRYRYEVKLDPDTGRPMRDTLTGQPLYERYSNELCIRAPSAGRVMAVYIREGDDALAVYRDRGAVILLSTDGRMKVELEDVGVALELGQTVNVRGTGVHTTGTVISLARQGTQAVIQVNSDEYTMNTPVTVTTQTGETAGEGKLAVNKPMAVSAYGGTIRSVDVKVGDTVKREDVLARFVWGEEPLYIDNASVLLDYAKASVELENARKKSEALMVTAPCDGRVASVSAAVGDAVEAGTQLMTIVCDDGMTLTLAVDELDIVAVEPGQRATMQLDALADVTLTGTVEKIAPLGNAGSAVTTYDVTIALDEVDERVLGGMNVSGEIVVDAAQQALLIPTDALGKQGGTYTVTLEDGSLRAVTAGIMTRDSVQILSGLTEGQTVVY